MSTQHLSTSRFRDFDLPSDLLQGIDEAGFSFCTPIQAQTLPLALVGRDVAGQAQTGTGKTAAFLVATLNWLMRHPASNTRRSNQIRALILAPTRELAIQIHRDAEQLASHTGLRLGLAYGGTGYEQQRQQLSDGVDILIGTPGRIIDYFKQRVFDMRALQVMVLDEADRMFDLGFIKDIRYLLGRMPPPSQRLGMLFSATLSHRVNELAYEHMNNPQAITVEAEQLTADKVEQAVFYPAMDEKIPLLIGLLRQEQPTRAIVFINTKRAGDKVQAWLEGNGFRCGVLSGDVPQRKRQHLLAEFEQGRFAIMVATDVAARGLHIPDVSHVFNYDLPQDAQDYVHRIGRTARAGASGKAFSFACEEYAFSLGEIEDYIEQKIPMQAIDAKLLEALQPPTKIARKPPGKRPPRRRDGGKRRGS